MAHLRTQRGSQRHSGRWGNPMTVPETRAPARTPQGRPRGHSAPRAGGTASSSRQPKSSPEHPMTLGGYERPGECGTFYQVPGRAFWDCTRIIMEWFGEEPKVGKGRRQGGLRPHVWGASTEREQSACALWRTYVSVGSLARHAGLAGK